MKKETEDLTREYAELLRKKLGGRIRQIVLFGSRARGRAGRDSDYDVLVVVDRRTKEAREAVLDVDVEMMNRHNALFAPLLYGEQEWRKMQDFPLAWNIGREGIQL